MPQQPDTVDLTNCDREPIHIPGSIQPHGVLLACDPEAVHVLRHSLNAPEALGVPTEINGQTLAALVGEAATHAIRNALATSRDASRPALLFDLQIRSGKTFHVAVHLHRLNVIVEFEPASTRGRPLQLARDLINRISDIDSVDRLISHSARLVHGLLGYDRVMIYRFEEDGAGKVVAEVKRPDLESFLGQYFPASDIPRQARALYLRNTIRVISDAAGHRVAIKPLLDSSNEPLDLSFAHLRSVSPVHLEYLRNMGVGASMSISVILDGELWGLIACHHYSPRVLPMAERVAAEMFGEFFSLHLNALKQKRKLDTANDARRSLHRFLRLSSHHGSVDDAFRESLPDFAQLMPCDGVGVFMNGTWSGSGITPPAAAISELARFVGSVAETRVWSTHQLSLRHPPAEAYADQASGVLAVPLSQAPKDYLFFFRRELVQTLDWAGNPEKSYETGPLGDRLTPRKSFAIWKETVHRQSQPWTESDREIAEAARGAAVEVVLRHNELMAEERSKAEVRQRMLNEELNHRVKNILAVIRSLVGHPPVEGRTLSDYVASLKGRIQALAFAHDQVVRSDGGGLLADLINAELSPYRGQSRTITVAGPRIWLDSRAFSVMALVLHEMATNAAKYGALSRPAGNLDVTWTLTADGDCTIEWVESGGPAVSPPSRQGLGSVLIDRSIPYDLGGKSSIDYAPEGIRAHFILSAKHVSTAEAKAGAAPAPGAAGAFPQGELGDPVILLVEDQMLIAMDVEATLADHGVTTVITTSSAPEALAKLAQTEPDIAVLDVNLGQGTSIPVAHELKRLGIPFIFATGYTDSVMIPPDLKGAPLVRKPYEGNALITAIAVALRATGKAER